MRILVLGGTGAMGKPLIELLSEKDNEVYVTSRSKHHSQGHIHYFQGDAHDDGFLDEVLDQKYDAVVDFMSYKSREFSHRAKKLLSSTVQYIFFSSSRVYSDSVSPITEDTPRLLDVCTDQEYLLTDEYALAKAREEDVLYESPKKNWTVIRPYITYNEERLQLGVYEKELWLYRVLNNQTVVFPKDIADCTTTMTYGADVARVVSQLIGMQEAFGETYHITTGQSAAWKDIIDIYADIVMKKTGLTMKVQFVETSALLSRVLYSRRWQIRYDRLYNRTFDHGKTDRVCGGTTQYMDLRVGLEKCLGSFIDHKGTFRPINPDSQAYMDRICREHTPLRVFSGSKNKLKYICTRYIPGPFGLYVSIYNRIRNRKAGLGLREGI